VLAGCATPAAGERLAADAPAAARLIPLTLDVTDAQQIAAAALIVDEQASLLGQPGTGRLDALVNNAGVGSGGPLELEAIDDLRRLFEVNTFGQVAVTQAMLPGAPPGTPDGSCSCPPSAGASRWASPPPMRPPSTLWRRSPMRCAWSFAPRTCRWR